MFSKDRQFDRRMLWVLIAFQALLFYNFYAREIAWYPPINFDQTAYLTQAYHLQEETRLHGLGAFWHELWRNGHGNTLAFPIEGALMGIFLGGTRLPQLGVLFIAFCALQFFAFATAQAIWERRAYGYAVLGLILSQNSLWFWAGGLFDFRMDFFAYCLYGIWACAVLRSNLFLDRRWVIVSGLIAAFLVVNRFLTAIYVVGVPAGFAGVCLIVWFLRRGDVELARRLRQRLLNLGIFLGILVVIAAPILLINRAAIYSKYVVAQFYYEKDIRARESGIVGLAGHLLYYPSSILRDHLGPTFLWSSAIGIVGSLIPRLLARLRGHPRAAEPTCHDETFLLQIFFLLGATIGPIAVLTLDISKSPVIGGVVGVPVTLLVAALMAGAANPRESKSFRVRNVTVTCSLVVFALGLFNQFGHAVSHLPQYAQRRDLERVAELNKWIADYARENGWRKPTISFDVISGSLQAGTITTSGFESSGELIEFQPTVLGGAIMGVDQAEALAALAHSDFVVLTDLPKTGVYPFYERISKYWNDLKAWADKNMIVARTVRLDSFTATVYTRPTATVSGLSGDWITSNGITLEVPNDVLQRFPKIRLSGAANYSWLPKVPSVSATVETGAETNAVPALLQRTDNSYEIMIDFSQLNVPSSDPVKIRLNFDTFFVPKKIGINGDTRELVVNAPTLVQLLPSGNFRDAKRAPVNEAVH
jgi:hypothetical protein